MACRADPQRVLILAGDLTEHGKQEQYAGLAELLGQLVQDGVRLVCCPGNHDLSFFYGYVPSPRGTRRDRYLDHITSLVTSQPELLGFTRYDAVLRIGQDVIISLRSVHRRGRILAGNRVRAEQIQWALAVLQQHDVTGQTHRIHFVTHYSLWALGPDHHRNMHRRRRLEQGLLVPCDVRTFINGHNHRFSAATRPTPKTEHRLYHIQAPSLGKGAHGRQRGYVCWDPSTPCSARVVELPYT